MYLVKTRLQQACDAAVLGGRKSMSGSNWGTANIAIANNFFNTNFTPGLYGSSGSTISYVGTVRISVCGRAVEHYAAMALMKRSPKMTANCALAMDHSRGGILHSFSERFKIR